MELFVYPIGWIIFLALCHHHRFLKRSVSGLPALIYAELSALMPETGGIYVYFKKMFGDFVAFIYGWVAFAVIHTATVAAISFV